MSLINKADDAVTDAIEKFVSEHYGSVSEAVALIACAGSAIAAGPCAALSDHGFLAATIQNLASSWSDCGC
jgi:hypothetical protein